MRSLLLIPALFLATGTAQAVTLAPGDTALGGTTLAAQPQLAGTVLDDMLQDFSITYGGVYSLTGTVQSRVVRSSVDNTLDFYWRVFNIQNNGPAPMELSSLRIGNFGMPVAGLNGDYRTDGLGSEGPTLARVFSGSLNQSVNFVFSDTPGQGLAQGDQSYFMFLDTNATNYGRTAFYDLTLQGTAGISGGFSTFGVAVPEPASWALMIGGFGLIGAGLRRRQRVTTTVRFA